MNTLIKWSGVLAFVMVVSSPLVANKHSEPPAAPQQKTATKTAKTYACPMHPEVKSTRKGKCPKCKMDLQPVRETATAVHKENPAPNVAVGEIVTASGASSAAASPAMKKLVIPDVAVLDQNGNSVHFYSDLVKGKTVAINFIFTNCTTICPPLAATFARVQRELGEKVGRDVHFISVSVDPLTDTPERLKAWGAKFKAGPGWTFVTGNKEEIDTLLAALGASSARREDHTPSVIIANDAKSVWTRSYGLAHSTQMVGLIENIIAGKLDDSQVAKEPTKP